MPDTEITVEQMGKEVDRQMLRNRRLEDAIDKAAEELRTALRNLEKVRSEHSWG